MSNHKSTESALKNLEVQMGQLAKQIADKSSNNFGANTENNPKEECKAVMTRSKWFMEAEDEENMVEKEQRGEKKGAEVKKNDVKGKENQEKGKKIMVQNKEMEDQEKEKEREKEKENEKNEKEKNKVAKKSRRGKAKHKSSDSRPQDQNDNRRFQSEEAWNRYIDNILDRRILLERNVELYHSEFDEFKVELERQNFHKRLANLQERSIDVAVVKEFYANFYSPADQAPKCARIRGHLIKIDADSLNEFLQNPTKSDPKEMEDSLLILTRGFILNIEGQPWKLLRKDLTTLAQTWSVFSYSNLDPTSHTSDLNTDRARLVYGLITRMDMNIGGLIYGQMTMMAQSNSSHLGFPALITTLCRSRGVGFDALTSYENLRPTIDLAYIIRNCWNANDQTVKFLEARKSKLRAADAPSSFAPIAGILASSTSPHSQL
ncbi:hypothetical protein GmHk_12G035113 [Glycine max]|nr:hypothetical protein GmHk_12G035113 [Glycine max]